MDLSVMSRERLRGNLMGIGLSVEARCHIIIADDCYEMRVKCKQFEWSGINLAVTSTIKPSKF